MTTKLRRVIHGVAACWLLLTAASHAGVSSGSPTLTAQIPVTGTVTPFASVAWTDCLFGTLAPGTTASCTSTVQLATNADLSLRWAATPLTNGSGARLLSSYQLTGGSGPAQTINPDTGQTAQRFQAAAPLSALTTYTLAGTAQNDPASTLAGAYQALVQLTLVTAATDLNAPTGLTVQAGDQQLTVSWNAVAGATSYEVGYLAGSQWDPDQATIVSASTTTTTLTGLINGQPYQVAVRSVFNQTRSGWSAPVTGTPRQPSSPALSFNGSTAALFYYPGITPVATDTFTIVFWVKPAKTIPLTGSAWDTKTNQAYAIAEGHGGSSGKAGAGVSVGTNGVRIIEHANSYYQDRLTWGGTLSSTQWTQLAVVYNNRVPSLYVNGALVATGTAGPYGVFPGHLGGPLTNLYRMGRACCANYSGSSYGGFYAGGLDQVLTYNRVLSTAELAQIRQGQLPTTGLVSRFEFDEGTGCTTQDLVTGVAFTLSGGTCPGPGVPQWITRS